MERETNPLSDAHRRAIGSRTEWIRELLARARARSSFVSDALQALETEVEAIERQTGAVRPAGERRELQGLLAELVVVAGEFAPRALRGYGSLPEDAAAYLEAASDRLREIALQLIDDYERSGRAV